MSKVKLKGQNEDVLRKAYRNTAWVRADIKSIINGQVSELGNEKYANFTDKDREDYFVEEVQMPVGIYDDNFLSEDGVVLKLSEV